MIELRSMKQKFRFLVEAQRNFGVGLMVGAFILSISEKIDSDTMWAIFGFGMVNVLISAILLPVEENNG